MPFKDEPTAGLRYYFANPFFSYGDAIILYSMLRQRRPRRVVEAGSGFSSAVMLDTNERFCLKQMRMTFIDPYPERLLALLVEEDLTRQHEVIADAVQGVSFEKFAELGANDLLFIDSSHVAKAGSDVVHLVTSVLPRLRKGVIVHFHDVFWPFRQPRRVDSWRQSLERGLPPQGVSAVRTRPSKWCSSIPTSRHTTLRSRKQYLPLFMKNPGGGLRILRKSASSLDSSSVSLWSLALAIRYELPGLGPLPEGVLVPLRPVHRSGGCVGAGHAADSSPSASCRHGR